MDYKENKLSEYIDKLNEEKKPAEHDSTTDSSELEELFGVVRQLRSLKEPAMPKADFSKKLARNVARRLIQKNLDKNKKRVWFTGMASAAAILIIAVMLNIFMPFNNGNIVFAMEEAFKTVKAYHGILEIVETNADGNNTTQGKLEVWADKEGHYYIKGLEGSLKGLITANNGQSKWQIRPDEKEVHVFPVFPDAYHFIFELGKEIDEVKNALSSKVIGEDIISGRQASIIEVSPKGGTPYKIWIDKETKLPLQKQTSMQKAIQYTTTYTEIDFSASIPKELISYNIPEGFSEINTNPEQVVSSMEEAQEAVGFNIMIPESIPAGYVQDSIAIMPASKTVKLYYTKQNKTTKIVVIQGKATGELKPASTAIIGKLNNITVEIQAPVYENLGILGGGLYAGITDISSIRWQEAGYEYGIAGNASLEELAVFAESLAKGKLEFSTTDTESSNKAQVEVPVNLEIEENEQKSVDAGSSPWRLDPVFVAQVFVSMQISPQGITGEYPVKYEALKLIQNTGTDAVVQVNDSTSPISKVYLKKLIRQDSTGIWTVVGYDPTAKE